jgi:hypothetical protein
MTTNRSSIVASTNRYAASPDAKAITWEGDVVNLETLFEESGFGLLTIRIDEVWAST